MLRKSELKKLLIYYYKPSETIDWIALKTGFANRNHFSHVFKKVTANPLQNFDDCTVR